MIAQILSYLSSIFCNATLCVGGYSLIHYFYSYLSEHLLDFSKSQTCHQVFELSAIKSTKVMQVHGRLVLKCAGEHQRLMRCSPSSCHNSSSRRFQSAPDADYNTELCPTPPLSHSKQAQRGNRCQQFQLTKPSADISNNVLFLKRLYDSPDRTIYFNWLLGFSKEREKYI